jgi:hypothetical protein
MTQARTAPTWHARRFTWARWPVRVCPDPAPPAPSAQLASHAAPFAGNWSVVTTLLETGVKAEIMDRDGSTPLALVLVERRRLEALEGSDDASLKLLDTLPQVRRAA